MKTNIKTTNVEKILQFANGDNFAMSGMKLKALYTLIQKKGEPIESDSNLNGLQCLKIGIGQYVAIDRVRFAKSFFPCKITTHLLSEI